VIVDVEPLLVILLRLDYLLYSYLHTFVSVVVLGSLTGVFMWLLRGLNKLFRVFLINN